MNSELLKLLDYDINTRRPQVVLLGNGPFRNAGINWNALLQETSDPQFNIDEFDINVDSNDESGCKDCPNSRTCIYIKKNPNYGLNSTIVASATCYRDDYERHNKYIASINEHYCGTNSFAEKLTKLPLDAILTTNYTYELEDSLKKNYSSLSLKQKLKYSFCTKYNNAKNARDPKYLIHTFNSMNKNYPFIWHIHGEVRRPSSLILNHDEYGRLIQKMLEFYSYRGSKTKDSSSIFSVKSWLDYFLVADIYVIGQGFDVAEFDLWWLLNRRIREKKLSIGSMTYYVPETQDLKHAALKRFDVNIEHLGVSVKSEEPCDISKEYSDFYDRVLDDIYSKIVEGNYGNTQM